MNRGWLAVVMLVACKRATPAPTVSASASASVSTSASMASAPVAKVTPKDDDDPPHPLVPAQARPARMCAVYGEFAQSERKAANALRDSLVASGVSDATIHDATDFNELPWGEIVVLSTTHGAKIDAGAELRGCTPLSGTLAISGAPATVKDTSEGCVGWNPARRNAACITGRYDEHYGHIFVAAEVVADSTVGVNGVGWRDEGNVDPDAKPTPEAVAQFNATLKSDGEVSLAGYRARLLAPGTELAWASPKMAVRYERRIGKHETWADDAITFTCAGKTKSLLSGTVIDSTDLAPKPTTIDRAATAKAYWAPNEEVLLVTWSPKWSSAGDSGREEHAAVVDVHKQCGL